MNSVYACQHCLDTGMMEDRDYVSKDGAPIDKPCPHCPVGTSLACTDTGRWAAASAQRRERVKRQPRLVVRDTNRYQPLIDAREFLEAEHKRLNAIAWDPSNCSVRVPWAAVTAERMDAAREAIGHALSAAENFLGDEHAQAAMLPGVPALTRDEYAELATYLAELDPFREGLRPDDERIQALRVKVASLAFQEAAKP